MSSPRSLTILFATQTGNTLTVADWAEQRAIEEGFDVELIDMVDCRAKDLESAQTLLLAVSTQGVGEPPFDAQELHKALHSDAAPRLEHLEYSVLALGDSGYEYFCRAGKEFDTCLENLGAKRFHPRVDCDVEFEATAKAWIESTLATLQGKGSGKTTAAVPQRDPEESKPLRDFVPLTLTRKSRLSGKGSGKEVIHLEFSLGDSGLTYRAGDTLAIRPFNSREIVQLLIDELGFDGDQIVDAAAGETLVSALSQRELGQLSRTEFEQYVDLAGSESLKAWFASCSQEELDRYLHQRDWLDIVRQHPPQILAADQFVPLLRKLAPRQYSISSSPMVYADDIHLTVAVVGYEAHGRQRQGVCSGYLADLVESQDQVQAYLQPNHHFRLPEDFSAPIIMLGPGVGIAPFRAFMQERRAAKSPGKSWLLLGDQHRSTDFLYEKEWQGYLEEGSLSHLDLAFSRDQPEKVYVQHRLREHSQRLYSWLEEGGHFYVCGDASHMARDVEAVLLEIIAAEGRRSPEAARDYLKQLRRERRYQLDIY